MIKAILFDWHGVFDKVTFNGLLNEATRRLFEYDDEHPINVIREVIVEPEFYDRGMDYARGKISPEVFWAEVHKYSPLRGLEGYLLKIDPNVDLWKQVPELATRYKVSIVSDVPSDKATLIRKFLRQQQVQFDPKIYSYEFGRLKVETGQPSLYYYTARMIGLSPSECLVIDDSNKNIESAKQEGFETIHYKIDHPLVLTLAHRIH